MNKIRKLLNRINLKFLVAYRFIFSDAKYKKISYKIFKKAGIVFHGVPKYINYDVVFDYTKEGLIHIGEGTVITKECVILTHDYSIEAGLVAINKNKEKESFFLREVHIGKNCFLGYRTIILPGTEIGDNCIVGSGSVLRGKYPSNSIIVGNPGKVVGNVDEWAFKKLEKGDFYNEMPK